MSDLFNSFSFDLQRFDDVLYSQASLSQGATVPAEGSFATSLSGAYFWNSGNEVISITGATANRVSLIGADVASLTATVTSGSGSATVETEVPYYVVTNVPQIDFGGQAATVAAVNHQAPTFTGLGTSVSFVRGGSTATFGLSGSNNSLQSAYNADANRAELTGFTFGATGNSITIPTLLSGLTGEDGFAITASGESAVAISNVFDTNGIKNLQTEYTITQQRAGATASFLVTGFTDSAAVLLSDPDEGTALLTLTKSGATSGTQLVLTGDAAGVDLSEIVMAANDSLTGTDLNILGADDGITLSYLSGGSRVTVSSNINFEDLESGTATLTYGGSSFALDGLYAESDSITLNGAIAEASGAITFDTDGNITTASLTGGEIGVGSREPSDEESANYYIKINNADGDGSIGGSVNVTFGGTSTRTSVAGISVVDTEDAVIEISGTSALKNGVTVDGVSVNVSANDLENIRYVVTEGIPDGFNGYFTFDTGDARLTVKNTSGSAIIIPAGDAPERGFYIGSTKYEYSIAEPGDDGLGSYFVVNGTSVDRFVFGTTEDAADDYIDIIGGGTAPAIYYNGATVPVEVSSSSDYRIGMEDGNFYIGVGDGAKVTVDGVEMTFSMTEGENFANIYFDATTYELLYVDAGAWDQYSIDFVNATDVATNEKGIIVNGDAEDTDGIHVDSGVFTYEVDSDSYKIVEKFADGRTIVIGEDAEVNKIVPQSSSKTVTLGEDTYTFTTSGNAYFTGSEEDGYSFVFVDKGDSLVVPASANFDITSCQFQGTGRNAVAVDLVPNGELDVDSLDDGYTITMTDVGTTSATFALSGLSNGAVISFFNTGDSVNSGEFTFGGEGGEFVFNASLSSATAEVASVSAAGVNTNTDGSVAFDLGAASIIAAGNFSIDGAEVQIVVDEDDQNGYTYYNQDGSGAIYGIDADASIYSAGNIEKIYVPNPDEGSINFVFGAGTEDSVTFAAIGARNGIANEPYFNITDGEVSGFTFINNEDQISGAIPDDFELTNGADGNTFKSPAISETEAGTADTAIITKEGEEVFSIALGGQSADEVTMQGRTVTFPQNEGTQIDIIADSADTSGDAYTHIYFNDDGELVSLSGLTAVGDEVKFYNAVGEVSIDGTTVDIEGGQFIYRVNDDSEAEIVGLGGDVHVIDAMGVDAVWTEPNEDVNVTFGEGTSAAVFGVSGANDDSGVQFFLDGISVTGISSIDNASVTGALNGLTMNGNEAAIDVTGDADDEFTFMADADGNATLGAVGGDEVEIVNAGGASVIEVIQDGVYKYGDSEATLSGGDSSVLFGRQTIDGLSGTVTIDFSNGITVNGSEIQVTGDGDSAVYAVGDDVSVTRLGKLDGDVVIVTAQGVEEFAVDSNKDANVDFAFAGQGESFAVSSNGDEETVFTLVDSAVAGISGIDEGESINGDFSNGITVNEEETIEITGDDDGVTVTKTDSGYEISGVSAGAVIDATGVSSTVIAESAGEYTFNNGTFTVSGDDVEFSVDDLGNVVSVDGASSIEFDPTDPDAPSPTINGGGSVLVIDENGNPTQWALGDGVLSVLHDGDTVISADSATTIRATAGVENIGFGNYDGAQEFNITNDADGADFIVASGSVAVTAVEGLSAGALVEGTLNDVKSINGTAIDIVETVNEDAALGDGRFAVQVNEGGISQILGLGGNVTVNDAGGASKAITNEEGLFTFAGGQSFEVIDDEYVEFSLDENSSVTAIEAVNIDAIVNDEERGALIGGNLNGVSINGSSAIDVEGDADNLLGAFAGESGVLILGGVGGDNVTVNNAGGAVAIFTDQSGTYTFNNAAGETFTVTEDENGADFGIEDGRVSTIFGLSGAVTGDFQEAIAVNGNEVQITGDSSIMVVSEDNVIEGIAGVNGGASILNAGGASEVMTSGDGEFTFFEQAGGTSQVFNTTLGTDDDGLFIFELDANGSVTGVEGFQNGTLAVDSNTSALDLNLEQIAGQSLVFTAESASAVPTFTVTEYEVTGVSGANVVNGLQNGEVTMSGTGTVNNKNIGIVDADNYYKVVVANGEVTAATEVTGDATVNVAGISVSAEIGDSLALANGGNNFLINGDNFQFADSDGEFSFTTADTTAANQGDLTAIYDLDGEVTIANTNGTFDISINGTSVGVTTSAGDDVIITAGDNGISHVDALANGATVTIANDNSPSVQMANDLTEIANSTIQSVYYDDGTLNYRYGEGAITALDDNATVAATRFSTLDAYTTNGRAYDTLNNYMVGTGNGDSAYNPISDELTLVRSNTSIAEIRTMLGLPDNYTVNGAIYGGHLDNTGDEPLNKEATDSLFSSEEPQDLDRPIRLYADNYTGDGDDGDNKVAQDIDFANASIANQNGSVDDFAKEVILYRGKQNVTLNNAGGNMVQIANGGSNSASVSALTVNGITYYVAEDTTYIAPSLRAQGEKNITLGSGGDVVIVDEGAAPGNVVNILGGAGNDTIFVRGMLESEYVGLDNHGQYVFERPHSSAQVNVTMTAGGDDRIVTYARSNARIALNNYQASTGAGIQIDDLNAEDIAKAVTDNFIRFGDGVISVLSGHTVGGAEENAQVEFVEHTASVDGVLANIYNPYGAKQAVGFTNSAGGLVDGSASADNLILLGNRDDTKEGGSTLIGGIGDDTIYAGGSDLINAGHGYNQIILNNTNTATMNDNTRDGAEIVISDGRTTITNAINAFNEYHGDTLSYNLSDAGMNIKFDATNDRIILENTNDNVEYAVLTGAMTDAENQAGGYAATLPGSSLPSADNADAPNLEATNSLYVNQLVKDLATDTTWKMAIGAEGSVIDVKADEDARANYYKGENIGVTFEKYSGEVLVDLSDTTEATHMLSYTDPGVDADVRYEGVISLQAGTGNTIFKGSDNNETLIAGSGNTSMYGADGNNLLVGYTGDATTKTGHTTFWVLGYEGGANNTIQGFAFINDDKWTNNSIAADAMEVQVETNYVKSADINESGQLVLEVTNRTYADVSESVIIEDGVTTGIDHIRDITFTATNSNGDSVVGQVADNNLYIDRFANYFVATGKNATVNVSDAEVTDIAKVWLANEASGKTFVGDVHDIDATAFTGKAELAGNDYNNVIVAGSGETSLWGGNFGDDALIGGAGKDTFYYQYGNGQDTISGAKEGDVVNLAMVSLDKITEANIEDGKLSFYDGGSLTVTENFDKLTFIVNGNETWKVKNGAWEKQATTNQ